MSLSTQHSNPPACYTQTPVTGPGTSLSTNQTPVTGPDMSLSTTQQSNSPGCFTQTPVTGQKRKRGDSTESISEEALRRRRTMQFIKNDENLHEAKMKEQQLKIQLVDLQIQSVIREEAVKKRRNEQDEVLHNLIKKKLELDIEKKQNEIMFAKKMFELKLVSVFYGS